MHMIKKKKLFFRFVQTKKKLLKYAFLGNSEAEK